MNQQSHSVAEIGDRIRAARTALKMSLQQVANRTGVTRIAVWNWENGKSQPRLEIAERLCETLEISLHELLTGRDIAIGTSEAIAATVKLCQDRLANALGVKADDICITVRFNSLSDQSSVEQKLDQ